MDLRVFVVQRNRDYNYELFGAFFPSHQTKVMVNEGEGWQIFRLSLENSSEPLLFVTSEITDARDEANYLLSGPDLAEEIKRISPQSVCLLYTKITAPNSDNFDGQIPKISGMFGRPNFDNLKVVINAYQKGMTIAELDAACPGIIQRF